MNIELIAYCPAYESATLARIACFWDFHDGLVGVHEDDYIDSARQDLMHWTQENHRLYIILADGQDVGFLHLTQPGPIVMELSDIFVDAEYRGRGVATAAIAQAEIHARAIPGIEAMVLQVVARNERALKMYRRIGFDTISTVTLRKEFGKNRRDTCTEFLGQIFHI